MDIININFTVDIHQEPANQRFLMVMYELIAIQKDDIKNITDFCSKTKIDKQKISYLKNKSRNITLEDLIKICARFDVSANWILFGTGEKFISLPK